MNKKYKYVLFDWDGCLAKTLDIWFWVEKDMLNKYGINPTDTELIKSFGDWEFGKKMGIKDNDKFIRELLIDVDVRLKEVKLYGNVVDVLERLKVLGVKMGIVTTSKRESLSIALEKYNLNNFFSVILAAEDVVKHKPDPEVVNKAMTILNAENEKTLIIGDGPKDIVAGKAAGITTVSFYPKDNERYYSEDDIKSYGADFVIKDLLELLKVVI
jgi:HAD superfamily hydrolase (TIGR01509 family)